MLNKLKVAVKIRGGACCKNWLAKSERDKQRLIFIWTIRVLS